MRTTEERERDGGRTLDMHHYTIMLLQSVTALTHNSSTLLGRHIIIQEDGLSHYPGARLDRRTHADAETHLRRTEHLTF